MREVLANIGFDFEQLRLLFEGERFNLDMRVYVFLSESGGNLEGLQIVRAQQGGGDVDMMDAGGGSQVDEDDGQLDGTPSHPPSPFPDDFDDDDTGGDAGDDVGVHADSVPETRLAGKCSNCQADGVATCFLSPSSDMFAPCCANRLCKSCCETWVSKKKDCPMCSRVFVGYSCDTSLTVKPEGDFQTRKVTVERQVNRKSVKRLVSNPNFTKPEKPDYTDSFVPYTNDDSPSEDDKYIHGDYTSFPYALSAGLKQEYTQEECGATVKKFLHDKKRERVIDSPAVTKRLKEVQDRRTSHVKDMKQVEKEYALSYLQNAAHVIDEAEGHKMVEPILGILDNYHEMSNHSLPTAEFAAVIDSVITLLKNFVSKELHAKVKKEKLDFAVNYLVKFRSELQRDEDRRAQANRERDADNDSSDDDVDDVTTNLYSYRGRSRRLSYRRSGRNSPLLS